jgi:hypothetical protein
MLYNSEPQDLDATHIVQAAGQRTRGAFTMRGTLLALAIASASTGLTIDADAASPQVVYVPQVVYLNSTAALAELRATNPDHYARAQRILAAANELCRPGPASVQFAKSDAQEVSCANMLLRTSNPPKRQITFRLDDTRYIALVTVTDDPPRLVLAR